MSDHFEILPILEAPKDTPLLTSDGVAISQAGSGLWYMCDWDGNIPSDCEEGISISEVNPSVFINARYEDFFTEPQSTEAEDLFIEMKLDSCPSLDAISCRGK